MSILKSPRGYDIIEPGAKEAESADCPTPIDIERECEAIKAARTVEQNSRRWAEGTRDHCTWDHYLTTAPPDPDEKVEI